MKNAPARKTWLYVLIGAIPAVAILSLTVFVMSRAIRDMGVGDGGVRVTQICASRLRTVSQGILLYSADHDGRLPNAEHWVDATWGFVTKKDPVDESESVFRCPTVSAQREGNYGYAFNFDLNGVAVKEQTAPETTPLVFDSKAMFRNASGPPVAAYPMPEGRHNGGKANVIAYLDGQVKVELDK
jgi:hypothetical protein